MELTSNNVKTLAGDCLPTGVDDYGSVSFMEKDPGIFDPEKLKEHEADIEDLLLQLDENFMDDSEGEGASALMACMDRHGSQWGEQTDVAVLLALGLAAGKVVCLAPKEFWDLMPGNVPYYAVLRSRFTACL